MVWIFLEMFYFLFAIEHLPALNAQHFSVALGLDYFKLVDELFPLGRLNF